MRLDPTAIPPRANLSSIYLSIGDTARFVSLRRQNLALQDPDGVVALGMQANLAHIEDGDYERALEIREQRIEREPGSSIMRFAAARAAFMAGDYERVVEHMTEGLRLSPNSRSGAMRHGLALIQTGRQQEGRAALTEVIAWRRGQTAARGEEAAPWLDLVVAYAALGETAEAMDAFDQVYEIGDITPVGSASFRQALALTSLESEPRFQAVWAQMEEDLAEMRRRIEAR
jgi:tetratricopeptide (TPR) repeat protein